MALAAVASGADGLIVEVHNDPPNAACDGAQSLTPEQFADLADKIRKIREVVAAMYAADRNHAFSSGENRDSGASRA